MNRLRFKFVRGDEVKYISHLDMMKVFERAARRAEIPVTYSQGFNPHPQMVFGLPLSVGVTSEAEYADFELDELMEPEEFIKRMNGSLPEGFSVIRAEVRQAKNNIMAAIAGAAYSILVFDGKNEGINLIREKIGGFISKPCITVKKEGKNGVRDVDIRPMIYNIEADLVDEPADPSKHDDRETLEYVRMLSLGNFVGPRYDRENLFCLHTLLSAGSASNLKPELLVSALNEAGGLGIKALKIHRTGLYVGKEGGLVEPLDPDVL